MTPVWYQPVSVVLSAYMGLCCAAFLVWFRPPTDRRGPRALVAAGMWLAAWGIVLAAGRALWRFRPGGDLPPLFEGQLDAASALAPGALFASAITLWLIAQRRDRRKRKAEG